MPVSSTFPQTHSPHASQDPRVSSPPPPDPASTSIAYSAENLTPYATTVAIGTSPFNAPHTQPDPRVNCTPAPCSEPATRDEYSSHLKQGSAPHTTPAVFFSPNANPQGQQTQPCFIHVPIPRPSVAPQSSTVITDALSDIKHGAGSSRSGCKASDLVQVYAGHLSSPATLFPLLSSLPSIPNTLPYANGDTKYEMNIDMEGDEEEGDEEDMDEHKIHGHQGNSLSSTSTLQLSISCDSDQATLNDQTDMAEMDVFQKKDSKWTKNTTNKETLSTPNLFLGNCEIPTSGSIGDSQKIVTKAARRKRIVVRAGCCVFAIILATTLGVIAGTIQRPGRPGAN